MAFIASMKDSAASWLDSRSKGGIELEGSLVGSFIGLTRSPAQTIWFHKKIAATIAEIILNDFFSLVDPCMAVLLFRKDVYNNLIIKKNRAADRYTAQAV